MKIGFNPAGIATSTGTTMSGGGTPFLGGVGQPHPMAVLLFGKRLPGLMNSLGRSVVEFKKGVNDTDHIESDDAYDRER